MINLIVTVLKKLATILGRTLNGDIGRIVPFSVVAPACALTGRRNRRFHELGNNAYPVADTPGPEREKPPPLAGATP